MTGSSRSEALCSDRFSVERIPDTSARIERFVVGVGRESTSLR